MSDAATGRRSDAKLNNISVRALTAQSEFQQAVDLQKEIWGFDDIELLPVRLFVVANKVGGQVFGAYDGARMAGFCLAIPGLKPAGKSYLHSHMLGVMPEYRDSGIGRLLKLKQREDALARSIDLPPNNRHSKHNNKHSNRHNQQEDSSKHQPSWQDNPSK